jgi:hypothetical protein
VLLLLQQAKVPGTASAGIEGIAACSPPIQSPLVESLGPVMCRFLRGLFLVSYRPLGKNEGAQGGAPPTSPSTEQ